jgi:hypothetical protein
MVEAIQEFGFRISHRCEVGRLRTMIAPIGVRRGNCSQATSPISGMARYTDRSFRPVLRKLVFSRVPRLSGSRISSSSAAGIITSSMSHAGMRCARESQGAGPATASRQPYGRLTSRRNPKQSGPRVAAARRCRRRRSGPVRLASRQPWAISTAAATVCFGVESSMPIDNPHCGKMRSAL